MQNEQIIHFWVQNMLTGNISNIHDMLMPEFNIEDGMTATEYIEYELDNFSRLSPLFDLDLDFKIKPIHTKQIDNDSSLVFFYIINKFNKIVCKMHLVVNHKKNKIGSNNNLSQVVPKYVIKNKEVSAHSLAIQSKSKPKMIYSSQFNDVQIIESASFDDDGFYNITMTPGEDFKFNSLFFFKIAYESGKIEKKPVFFDIFNPDLCPVVIEGDKISLLNDMYPVGIAVFYKNKQVLSEEYPRNFEISKDGVLSIIVTDVLDNDWHFSF